MSKAKRYRSPLIQELPFIVLRIMIFYEDLQASSICCFYLHPSQPSQVRIVHVYDMARLVVYLSQLKLCNQKILHNCYPPLVPTRQAQEPIIFLDRKWDRRPLRAIMQGNLSRVKGKQKAWARRLLLAQVFALFFFFFFSHLFR